MRAQLLIVIVILLLVGARGSWAGPKVDPKAEAKAREKLAEDALAGAGTLIAAGARAEALRVIAEAEALGAAKDKVDPLRTQARTLPEGETAAAGLAAWKTVAADL